MLRRVVTQSQSGAVGTPIRRWLAAGTAKQKRALDTQQLGGGKGSAAPASEAAASNKLPPPYEETPLGVSPSSGGGEFMLPVAIAASIFAGGAYYFLNVREQPKPAGEVAEIKMSSPPKKETTPKVEKKIEAAAASNPPKEESTTSSVGNRVRTVEVPSKMKNSTSSAAAATISAPSHPVQGNRVAMNPSSSKAAAVPPVVALIDTNSSMTENAIKELNNSVTEQAAESVIQSHQSLWSAMDESFFRDLDALNSSQLKARVVQLATEMKDRTKWEAVRLKEFLAMKEQETADKYMQVLQKQRLEFEDLLAKRMREQENSLVQQTQQAMQEKDAAIKNLLTTALEAQSNEHEEDKKVFQQATAAEIHATLEDEYSQKMEEFKAQATSDLEKKVSLLEALTSKIEQLEKGLEASQTNQQGSVRAHRLSAAALALAEKLETNQGAASELRALKVAAGTDGVIATALATIPKQVQSGVPTLSELQTRFESVHKKCRQAALVPAGRPGLEGQLAGMVFATLKYPPNPEDAAPEYDKDNAEFLLVRARKHVQLGEVERAVEQLEKLEGQAAFTVADWKKDALNRIAVEKALKVIKMECALVNESMVE